MAGPNQSNELSMLDGDDGSVSPDFLQYNRSDCTIRVFDYSVYDNAQLCT